jgi:hypothetical protein
VQDTFAEHWGPLPVHQSLTADPSGIQCPIEETPCGAALVSQGRSPEASRMPRPMMIRWGMSTGTAGVTCPRLNVVALGVARSAGMVGRLERVGTPEEPLAGQYGFSSALITC